jgi:hypothetical protein
MALSAALSEAAAYDLQVVPGVDDVAASLGPRHFLQFGEQPRGPASAAIR